MFCPDAQPPWRCYEGRAALPLAAYKRRSLDRRDGFVGARTLVNGGLSLNDGGVRDVRGEWRDVRSRWARAGPSRGTGGRGRWSSVWARHDTLALPRCSRPHRCSACVCRAAHHLGEGKGVVCGSAHNIQDQDVQMQG